MNCSIEMSLIEFTKEWIERMNEWMNGLNQWMNGLNEWMDGLNQWMNEKIKVANTTKVYKLPMTRPTWP